MKVKELIEKLKEYDPEMYVHCGVKRLFDFPPLEKRVIESHETIAEVKLQRLLNQTLYVVIEVE